VAENDGGWMAGSADALNRIAAGSVRQYRWLGESGNGGEKRAGDASQPRTKRSMD
jgi:hypothetical protein